MEFQQGLMPIFKNAPLWGKMLIVAGAVAVIVISIITCKK